MKIDIENLSEEQLVELNHRIVERLKFLESVHAHHEMMRFSVGQKVSFQPSGRDRQIGTLVKYNKKTVTVITESGQKWNVSPHLLSLVKDVKNKPDGRGHVIDLKPKGPGGWGK